MKKLLKIDNYAINVDQIQCLHPFGMSQTTIYFIDRSINIKGDITIVAKAIDDHLSK